FRGSTTPSSATPLAPVVAATASSATAFRATRQLGRIDATAAVGGTHDPRLRFPVHALAIVRRGARGDLCGRGRGCERDDASSESRACEPGAMGAGVDEAFHQRVEFRNRYLHVVA